MSIQKPISDNAMSYLQMRLEKHEGMRQFPYVDTTGNTTIGIGRNLTAKGISHLEAMFLLNNDIGEAQREVWQFLPQLHCLDEARLIVLIELAFNIGIEHVLQFKKMIAALVAGDFKKASAEMLNSEWAKQVGMRAHEMAYQMETGVL